MLNRTKTDLLIRPSVEGDSGAIIDLLKMSLGEGPIPRDIRYWSWKHLENPFGVSPVLLAEQEGKLVGLRVFMRWCWMQGGQEVRAVRAVDTATHPDWQGRGIFTRLTLALVDRMESDEVAFIFNTPNKLSRPGYLKMGWSDMGRVSLWVRPRGPLSLARTIAMGGYGKVSKSGSRTAARLEKFNVREELQRPELDSLLESHAGDPRLTTRVSIVYLNWRYSEIPGLSYHAAGTWDKGEEALVIFRLRPRGALTELRVCQIFAGRGWKPVDRASALIRHVIHATNPDFTVAMAALNTPEHRVLLRTGFLPAPRMGPMLTVRPITGRAESLLRWSCWRPSIGDLELF